MHEVLHCLDLLRLPGICAAVILAWAVVVRLFWRRKKSVRMP
ncbi:MAG TPA: hypothetical protein VMG38_19515 [Trebonia sp.]|nr:hypothetical protein [Trebonia sp.]